MNDVRKSIIDGLEWPTEELKMAVKNLDKGNRSNIVELGDNVIDITDDFESRFLLLIFMPSIKLIGLDLWLERWKTKNWGGVFARALKSKYDDHICLQYIFTYARQLTIISPLWMVLIPAFLSLLDLFVLSYPDTVVAYLPLLLYGVILHLGDTVSRFRFRSSTVLIFFWLLEFIRIDPSFEYIPSLIMGSCALISGVLWTYNFILKRSGTPGSHSMDYIPVFIWLRHHDILYGNYQYWHMEKASWDVLHYKGVELDREQIAKNVWRLVTGDENWDPFLKAFGMNRLKLEIDNSWHSLTRSRHVENYEISKGTHVSDRITTWRGLLIRTLVVACFFVIAWVSSIFVIPAYLYAFVVLWLIVEFSRIRFDLYEEQSSTLEKIQWLYTFNLVSLQTRHTEMMIEIFEDALECNVEHLDDVMKKLEEFETGYSALQDMVYDKYKIGLMYGLMSINSKIQNAVPLQAHVNKIRNSLHEKAQSTQDDRYITLAMKCEKIHSGIITLYGLAKLGKKNVNLEKPIEEIDKLWKNLQLTYINDAHLIILWNLGSSPLEEKTKSSDDFRENLRDRWVTREKEAEKAQFLVRKKIQNPFTMKFDSFLDD